MKKVGIIGLGSISARHKKNIKLLYPDIEILLMSSSGRDIDALELDGASHVESLSEMLSKNPDFVIVSSPASMHGKHAIPFIESSIPVLIEKPISHIPTEAKKIVDAIKSEKDVCIGYCLRYLPSAKKVKELVDGAFLGKIYSVNIEAGQFLPDWRPQSDYRKTVSAKADLGGGVLLELSHEFDYARWIFGELTPQYAITRSSSELNLEVEDLADILLLSKTDVVIHMHLDFLQKAPHRSCSIIGEKGRLDWDLISNSVVFRQKGSIQLLYSQPDWDKNNMYIEMMEDFISKKTSTPNYASSLDAYSVSKLIDQIKDMVIKKG